MIVQLARATLITVGALGGFEVSQQIDWSVQTGLSEGYVIFVFIILGASIGYVLGGILGRELTTAYRNVQRRLSELEAPTLLLGAAGFVSGLLVAYFLSSSLLSYIERPQWLGFLATILLYIFCAYAGVTLFMLPSRDVSVRWSTSSASPVDDRPPKLLDTSAIIDARFAELARLGLLEGPLRVPRFVLVELQTLADSADDTRRARGRRGLDLLTALSAGETKVLVIESDFPEIPTVDAKLVRLALATGGTLVTVDYNLTKVARVEGASVFNVSEAAEALRPVLLPGDELHIVIVKEGKEAGQGVGYLGDGTMVVVADGSSMIGAEVGAEVTSVLQTSAGRMVFARLKEDS
ncbi:MAG: hypothetical protein JXA36_02930 [Coriobacteriia bacterium]|nr:hypothetical protein [Coriobacteriia bacterium]